MSWDSATVIWAGMTTSISTLNLNDDSDSDRDSAVIADRVQSHKLKIWRLQGAGADGIYVEDVRALWKHVIVNGL